MYKPPQNTNRVQSLKNKFENLETKNSQKLHEKICENSLGKSTNQELPTLQRQLSDPLKMNIKRTPAFRVEKSVVENCGLQRYCFDKSDMLESKMRLYTTVKNHFDNPNCWEKNVERKMVTSDKLIGSSMTCKNYNSQSISEQPFQMQNVDGLISNLYTQPIPKALRSSFIHSNVRKKDICNSNICSISEENENVLNTELLTDTLKIALKKPLPQGPAPRKPPRTFQHFQKQSDTKKTCSVVLPSMKNKERSSSSRTELKNKKTDAKYMLNKLEYALKNNRLNVKKQHKRIDTTVISSEDSDDATLCKSDLNKCRHNSPTNENNLNSTFNLNCLSLINCSRSEYEIINQPLYDESDYLLKQDDFIRRDRKSS